MKARQGIGAKNEECRIKAWHRKKIIGEKYSGGGEMSEGVIEVIIGNSARRLRGGGSAACQRLRLGGGKSKPAAWRQKA